MPYAKTTQHEQDGGTEMTYKENNSLLMAIDAIRNEAVYNVLVKLQNELLLAPYIYIDLSEEGIPLVKSYRDSTFRLVVGKTE